MKKLFKSITNLDNKLVSEFGLSEDILQENAASSLNLWIRKHLKKGKKVQILCGCGNNGADGLACARMLANDYKVSILLPLGVKSPMAKVQFERTKKLHVKIDTKLKKAHLYLDAIFGSGLNRALSDELTQLLTQVNEKKAIKLSCDVPTGIMENGDILKTAFKAHTTITMGALKESLFSDKAKDYVGKLHVSSLGVSRDAYESQSDSFVLQKKDLHLPKRLKQDTNKGSFGHLVVISGEKQGAAKLCAKAGFAFGAGLVSIKGEDLKLPDFIMGCQDVPQNATCIAVGMGLGALDEQTKNLLTNTNSPLVLDADILANEKLKDILHIKTNVVLTPHPKEFSKMCKILDFGDFTVGQIQANRFELAREFSLKFSQVLVLKGANTIIGYKGKFYVCPYGNSSLAKGGSGDVLSGLIGSLLAQGYSPLNSAINGVLAHALSISKLACNSYALSPNDIIKGVKIL